jgi:hypothetical protein
MTRFLVILALWFCLLLPASADVVYHVSVNTGSISGIAGSLDFQFNPGPQTTQPASLDLQNFASDGTLAGSPALTGDVSGGPLPATVTFDNGGALNDYFDGFTFGNTLAFDLRFYGPAISSPGGEKSGSTFAFSMFSDSAGTSPALTGDTADGFAFTVDINTDGTTTVTNFSPETTITAAVPEPSSFMLLGSSVAALAAIGRRPRIKHPIKKLGACS